MLYIITTLPGTGYAFDSEDEARDYTLALDRCGIEYTIEFPAPTGRTDAPSNGD